MARCKNCHGAETVKNGCVRNKQRYQCKDCGYNFVVGDARMKAETAVKRAFAVILYALGKSSYGFIAKLFGVTPPAVQKWLQGGKRKLLAPTSWQEEEEEKSKKSIVHDAGTAKSAHGPHHAGEQGAEKSQAGRTKRPPSRT